MDSFKEEAVEFFINAVISNLPRSKDTLDQYRTAQAEDPTLSKVMTYCRSEWPEHPPSQVKPFHKVQAQLSICQDLLLYCNRIVVPPTLQKKTLDKIHQGHQGILKCRLRARNAVWWPGMGKMVEAFIQSCPQCAKSTTSPRESLLSTPLPKYPWERVGVDLFEFLGSTYLVVVDYFSRYPEVSKLNATTSKSVITTLKSIFARHGVPAVLMSNNGPQFSSQEMKEFAESYSFSHVTSSPQYPQSNGLAERTVKTVKALLKDAPDPYMALLSYRTTPLAFCNLSPAELLMGCRVQTDVPQISTALTPRWSYLSQFKMQDAAFKEKQAEQYNQRHRTRDLDILPDDMEVWVTSGNAQTPGQIICPATTPRSYIVDTPTGQLRRNRTHLNLTPTSEPQETNSTDSSSPIMTHSRTGTSIHPPDRFHP